MSLPPKPQSHPSGDNRFKLLDRAITKHHAGGDALIEVLHAAQGIFGYLENDLLIYVARALKLPLSRVYGVATFYHFFSLKPKGTHTFVLCTGTACYIKGSGELVEGVRQKFGVEPGGTTADQELSVVGARCIGACSLAPAAVVDGEVLGNQAVDQLLAKIAKVKHDAT